MSSPLVTLLNNLKQTLVTTTKIPVFFTWQKEDQEEPFIVLAGDNNNDMRSPKAGKAVIDTNLQAHLFYPGGSRLKLEDNLFEIKHLIYKASDRVTSVSSETIKDDSVGREVYHVVINISAIV